MDGITTYTIKLDSSMSASMSRNTAAKIQMAVKMNCDLKAKCEEEYARKLIFKLEF